MNSASTAAATAPRKGHIYIDGLDAAKTSMAHYLLTINKGLKPLASSSRSKKYGCQGYKADGSGCRFEVRLTKTKEGMWNTSYINLAHDNCASAVVASNSVIKDLLRATVAIDPQVKATVLREQCVSVFGIKKSLRSVNRAKTELVNQQETETNGSFGSIPSYLRVLERKNEGTITDIEQTPTKQFHRLFVMLASAAHVTVNSPKKVCVKV